MITVETNVAKKTQASEIFESITSSEAFSDQLMSVNLELDHFGIFFPDDISILFEGAITTEDRISGMYSLGEVLCSIGEFFRDTTRPVELWNKKYVIPIL